MPGQITTNTPAGERRKAQKNLEGTKVEAILNRLDEIITEMDTSPTVAQRTEATKDLARALKHLINHLRR